MGAVRRIVAILLLVLLSTGFAVPEAPPTTDVTPPTLDQVYVPRLLHSDGNPTEVQVKVVTKDELPTASDLPPDVVAPKLEIITSNGDISATATLAYKGRTQRLAWWGTTLTLPAPSGPSEVWTVRIPPIQDKAGNAAAADWTQALLISGDPSYAGPTISKFDVQPTETIDVSRGPVQVTVSLQASDTLRPLVTPLLKFGGDSSSEREVHLGLVSGTKSRGVWEATITIPQGAGGQWWFQVEAQNDIGLYSQPAQASLFAIGGPKQRVYPATGVFGDHTGDQFADMYRLTEGGGLYLLETLQGNPSQWSGYVGHFPSWTYMVQIGDWNGDRRSDMLVRRSDHSLWIYTTTATGSFQPWRQVGRNWDSMDKIVYAGALTGTDTKYVVGRQTSTGDLYRYQLTASGLLGVTKIGQHWSGMKFFFSVGDFNSDGRGDIIGVRESDGTMWVYPGRKDGKIDYGRQVGRGWDNYVYAFSPGDMSGDGRFDLVGVNANGWTLGYNNNGKSGWTYHRELVGANVVPYGVHFA